MSRKTKMTTTKSNTIHTNKPPWYSLYQKPTLMLISCTVTQSILKRRILWEVWRSGNLCATKKFLSCASCPRCVQILLLQTPKSLILRSCFNSVVLDFIFHPWTDPLLKYRSPNDLVKRKRVSAELSVVSPSWWPIGQGNELNWMDILNTTNYYHVTNPEFLSKVTFSLHTRSTGKNKG